MRILFVCAFLNQHGGFENYARALVDTALGAGHSAAVLTPFAVRRDATVRHDLPASVVFDSAQEAWRRTLFGSMVYRAVRAQFRLRTGRLPGAAEDVELARGSGRTFVDGFWRHHGETWLRGVDLIHLVGKPKHFLVEAAAAARGLGKPVVYSEVAHVDRRYAEEPGHRAFVGAADLCDLVLTYSQAQLEAIRLWFGYRGPGRVVEQSAYGKEDELLALERPRRDDTEVVLGSLSRLSPEKDLALVLEAFGESRRERPWLRLEVAGAGSLEGELRQLVRTLGLETAVRFLGYVEDQVGFYRTIDAFVIASREEGGPITGVEAMAAGLPIVTTPVGAMPERLHPPHEALFVADHDRTGLAAAMCRLADDPDLRRELGSNARRRYRERCSSRSTTAALVDAWEEITC